MKSSLVSPLKPLPSLLLLGSLWLAAAIPAPTTAVPLPPGTSVLAPAEPDPVGGAVIGGPLVSPFSAGTFSGSLTSTVIAGDAANPFGGLTFTYQLSNSQTSSDSIGRITINDFLGFLTDASFKPTGGIAPTAIVDVMPVGGMAPTTIDRSATGTTIGFSFLNPPVGIGSLVPGATSELLVIQTSAQIWGTSFASVIDATVATSVATYAPSTIPEPSALAFIGLGFAAFLIHLRFPTRRG